MSLEALKNHQRAGKKVPNTRVYSLARGAMLQGQSLENCQGIPLQREPPNDSLASVHRSAGGGYRLAACFPVWFRPPASKIWKFVKELLYKRAANHRSAAVARRLVL